MLGEGLTEDINNKNNENGNFTIQFWWGSISKTFDNAEFEEIFKGNVYDFAVDYNAVDKCEILNIHKYLTIKNNIK